MADTIVSLPDGIRTPRVARRRTPKTVSQIVRAKATRDFSCTCMEACRADSGKQEIS
jgi:hypothetical protein